MEEDSCTWGKVMNSEIPPGCLVQDPKQHLVREVRLRSVGISAEMGIQQSLGAEEVSREKTRGFGSLSHHSASFEGLSLKGC